MTSEEWNNHKSTDDKEEIFIERNGLRFQYVLDYMRDTIVSLPLAIPRAQFILDLDYFNIDYEDSQIKLSVADPKDLFYHLESYREFFDSNKKDIDARFRKVAVEKVACELASEYFERIGRPGCLLRNDNNGTRYIMNGSYKGTECVTSYFVPTQLRLPAIEAPKDISAKDIQPLMEKKYGLAVSRKVETKTTDCYGREQITYSHREVDVCLLSNGE